MADLSARCVHLIQHTPDGGNREARRYAGCQLRPRQRRKHIVVKASNHAHLNDIPFCGDYSLSPLMKYSAASSFLLSPSSNYSPQHAVPNLNLRPDAEI
jgi:hypothetical protein